ncbi:MAG: cytochrome c-type biogenesis protein [Paracoccaceae bacterium]
MRGLALILALIAAPAWAVDPSEMLEDPELEARARALSAELRCPVCTSESIDESNAQLARDLRVAVRDRLLAGDTDREALDWIAARYGEAVLLRPDASGANLALWLAAPALLLLGGAAAVAAVRRRTTTVETLSDEERARLDAILRE